MYFCFAILRPINSQKCRREIQYTQSNQYFGQFPIKKNYTHLIDVSSKGNWCRIYQIKALNKTFFLHIVSQSGILACVLRCVHLAISLLQGPEQYHHLSSTVSVRFCAFLRWLRAPDTISGRISAISRVPSVFPSQSAVMRAAPGKLQLFRPLPRNYLSCSGQVLDFCLDKSQCLEKRQTHVMPTFSKMTGRQCMEATLACLVWTPLLNAAVW